MLKKIQKKINSSPRRVKNFYSNVIAGVISGGSIAAVLAIIQETSGINWKLPSVLQVVSVLALSLLLYIIGKCSMNRLTSSDQEIKGYKSNIQAGFFASFFLTILLVFPSLKVRLLVIAPLTVAFILAVLLLAGRRKS